MSQADCMSKQSFETERLSRQSANDPSSKSICSTNENKRSTPAAFPANIDHIFFIQAVEKNIMFVSMTKVHVMKVRPSGSLPTNKPITLSINIIKINNNPNSPNNPRN